MRRPRLRDIRRILVLNRNHIGDCLLTTPMLRALKREYPHATLTVAIPAANTDLLSANPHVDEIILRPKESNWGAKVRFALAMRARRYDLIISLQEKSLFYAWSTAYTRLLNPTKPLTIALEHPRTRGYYEVVSPVHPDQHEVHKYLDLTEMLACPKDPNPVLEILPPPSSSRSVQEFLSSNGIDHEGRFIGINPGGTKREKRWPPERFAAVGDRLHEHLKLPVVVLGGPGDRPLAAEIVAHMKHRPLVAAGRCSLGETAALLERCELLVTGDTGPMHLAVAQAVPVVALFGPTSPVKYGPFSTLSQVLRHKEPCPECTVPCIHTIQPQEVVEAALKLYTGPPSRKPVPEGS